MVVCIVEGRTYEVCHAGIEDDKLTVCGLLDIKTFGNERTALTHDGASQFEVELLTGAELKVLSIGVEELAETWYGMNIRLLIVYAQTATYIYILHWPNTILLQSVLKFVDTKR